MDESVEIIADASWEIAWLRLTGLRRFQEKLAEAIAHAKDAYAINIDPKKRNILSRRIARALWTQNPREFALAKPTMVVDSIPSSVHMPRHYIDKPLFWLSTAEVPANAPLQTALHDRLLRDSFESRTSISVVFENELFRINVPDYGYVFITQIADSLDDPTGKLGGRNAIADSVDLMMDIDPAYVVTQWKELLAAYDREVPGLEAFGYTVIIEILNRTRTDQTIVNNINTGANHFGLDIVSAKKLELWTSTIAAGLSVTDQLRPLTVHTAPLGIGRERTT